MRSSNSPGICGQYPIAAVDGHGAGVGPEQARADAHQRGLARAVLAGERHDLAAVHRPGRRRRAPGPPVPLGDASTPRAEARSRRSYSLVLRSGSAVHDLDQPVGSLVQPVVVTHGEHGRARRQRARRRSRSTSVGRVPRRGCRSARRQGAPRARSRARVRRRPAGVRRPTSWAGARRPDPRGRVARAAPSARAIRAAPAAVRAEHRRLDVLPRGEPGNEVVELEDDADLLAPEPVQVADVTHEVVTGHDDRAGVGRFESGEQVEHRRLARAGRPDEDGELAAPRSSRSTPRSTASPAVPLRHAGARRSRAPPRRCAHSRRTAVSGARNRRAQRRVQRADERHEHAEQQGPNEHRRVVGRDEDPAQLGGGAAAR